MLTTKLEQSHVYIVFDGYEFTLRIYTEDREHYEEATFDYDEAEIIKEFIGSTLQILHAEG